MEQVCHFLMSLSKIRIGILAISVYRKDSTELYIVLFRSDHPQHVVKNIIEDALMWAVCYSSTLLAFNEEWHLMKLMLLYNGLVFQHILGLIFCFFRFSLTDIYRDISILDSRNYHQTRSYLWLPIRMMFYLYALIY